MTTIQLSPECSPWHFGDETMHPPADREFLEALARGLLHVHRPERLVRRKSAHRSAIAIHRGRGKKWELVFREHESDVVTTTTTDLPGTSATVLSWLRGGALSADENSLRAVAG